MAYDNSNSTDIELNQLEIKYASSSDSSTQRNMLTVANKLFKDKSIPLLLKGLSSTL